MATSKSNPVRSRATSKPFTITDFLLCIAIGIVVLIGVVGFVYKLSEPKGPNRKEFLGHLEAQGGWYAIQWDKDRLGVEVKHDLEGEPFIFYIKRNRDGIIETIRREYEVLSEVFWVRDTKKNEKGYTQKELDSLYAFEKEIEDEKARKNAHDKERWEKWKKEVVAFC